MLNKQFVLQFRGNLHILTKYLITNTIFMTAPFTSSASLSAAWKAFTAHWKFVVPATVLTAAIIILLQVITRSLENYWLPSLIFVVFSILAGIAITLGWSKASLKLAHAHSVSWRDFRTNEKSWGHYFLARIIFAVFTVAAMILILIPVLLLVMTAGSLIPLIIIGILVCLVGVVLFIWLALRYMFISFVAVDHPTMNAWGMLKESARLGKGHMVDLFGFGMLLLLINIFGFVFFLIGLIITVPISKIAVAHVYEQLKKKHHAVAE